MGKFTKIVNVYHFCDYNCRMSSSAEVVEAQVAEKNEINSEVIEELPIALAQKSVECSVERKNSLQARYSYGIIFLLTNLSAWFIRDYGQKVFPQLECKSTLFFLLQYLSKMLL